MKDLLGSVLVVLRRQGLAFVGGYLATTTGTAEDARERRGITRSLISIKCGILNCLIRLPYLWSATESSDLGAPTVSRAPLRRTCRLPFVGARDLVVRRAERGLG